MAAEGNVIDLTEWCSRCHRRLDEPSPNWLPGEVGLIILDRQTGRRHHVGCRPTERRSRA